MAAAGDLYAECRQRVVALTAGLSPEEAATPVPACPGWTVHDVVAHLCGVLDDSARGRMEGAPSPAWTAKQVAARRERSIAELHEEWAELAATFESLPVPFQAVADVASHEQDLRGALHRPGFRDNAAIAFAVPLLLDRFVERSASHGLAPLEVRCGGDAVLAGGENPGSLVTLTTTPFEMFRATLGHRSRAQVLSMDWEGEAEPYLDHLFVFPPPAHDLQE